ncbi:MAG TPA: ABC transporter substrate-binding protein [Alphaproteobacteria bacterium]|nr:ABC transporter substrate-binding protein [Alphaproteobacteria bacterium]
MLLLSVGAGSAQNLVIGTKLELNTLDPHFFSAFPTQSSHQSLFDALVWLDKDLKQHPALATEWKVLDDTTWEFKLRRGVKFHDGSDFDADDVIATFKRVPNVPNSPNSFSQFMRSVKEIVKVDSHTLHMKTDAPNPNLSHDLSSVFIISKKYAEATTQDFNSGSAVVGTGPYRLAEWKNGERLVLQRFDGHWGGKAPWAQVTERILAKDSARVAALLSDEVDVIDLVPSADLPRIKSDPRFKIYSGAAAVIHYIALDSARDDSPFIAAKDGSKFAKNPLRDARVRKALSLAINRDGITKRLMEGAAIPAAQLLPSSFDGTSQTLKPDPFDLDRAKALLREAGWGDGFKIMLHATGDRYPKDSDIAQAIGQTWTRLGLTVEVQALPGSIFFSRASKQEFSAFIAQYGTSEASQALRALVASWNPEKGFGTANRTRHSNPEFDALFSRAVVTMDLNQRRTLLAQASEMAMREQAVIPVFFPTWEFAAKNNVVVEVRADRRANAMMMTPRK